MLGDTMTAPYRDGGDIQAPADAAVVVPTVLRPSLSRAVESVYAQELHGRIHLLIGVDAAEGDRRSLDRLVLARPDHVAVTVMDLGYSTSRRHGGLHPAHDGGALRTILSYAANSARIAYLDDDNWWHPEHLVRLLAALDGEDADWAFAYRWYVEPESLEILCIDEWESVGPGRGIYAVKKGGFTDPSTLMIDKTHCEPVLRLWGVPAGDRRRMDADRTVFAALARGHKWAATGHATAYYVIDPADPVHDIRLGLMEGRLKAKAE
jgi:hypothetical protein